MGEELKKVEKVVMADLHNAGQRIHQIKDHLGNMISLLPGRTVALEKSIADRLKRAYSELISPDDLRTGAPSDYEGIKLENAQLKESVKPLKGQIESLKKTIVELTTERDFLKDQNETFRTTNLEVVGERDSLKGTIETLNKEIEALKSPKA